MYLTIKYLIFMIILFIYHIRNLSDIYDIKLYILKRFDTSERNEPSSFLEVAKKNLPKAGWSPIDFDISYVKISISVEIYDEKTAESYRYC